VGPGDQLEKKKGKGQRLLGCCGWVGLMGFSGQDYEARECPADLGYREKSKLAIGVLKLV
jgi:hypothetical protein